MIIDGDSLPEWIEIGDIQANSSTVGFGDPAVLGESFVLGGRNERDEDLATSEGALVYQSTDEDCPLPVEVVMGEDGRAVAARIEFVYDVDDVEGVWLPIGKLVNTGRRCIAFDPFWPLEPKSGNSGRLEFPVEPGTYIAETFVCKGSGDVLGLRIVPDSWLTLESQGE